MNVKIILVTMSFVLLAIQNLWSRMVDVDPVGEIPFEMGSDSRIYVTAFVNGSDSLRFLVDTGASTIVLNTDSPALKGRIHSGYRASNMGTTGENSISFSNDNAVTVGTIEFKDAGCAHIPYPPELWDGVFGLNGLAAFNVEINYDDSKIYCYQKDLAPGETLMKFTFEYRYDVPFITLPVKVNGRTYDLDLEVDTGSDRVIDLGSVFVSEHRLLESQRPFAISHIASSDGNDGELRNVYFDEVVVGPYRMPKVAGAFSTLATGMLSKKDVDGMIGNNFLKRFNMYIDFSGENLYLQPNNLYYTPFYDFLVK